MIFGRFTWFLDYLFTFKYGMSQSTFIDLMYVHNYLIDLRVYRFTGLHDLRLFLPIAMEPSIAA